MRKSMNATGCKASLTPKLLACSPKHPSAGFCGCHWPPPWDVFLSRSCHPYGLYLPKVWFCYESGVVADLVLTIRQQLHQLSSRLRTL